MKKIIIDTDPGADDAATIFMAVNHPEIELVGLTTVFGNATTEQSTKNALKLLEIAEREDIPVAQGAEKPLNGVEFEVGGFVHGNNGLGDIEIAEPKTRAINQNAAEFIVQQIMDNPGEISLCAIAPLTNLAEALKLEPQIAQKVKEVVIMGGTIDHTGNISPVAEANVWNDAYAADKVLTAGWDITMVGLNVTMGVILDQNYLSMLKDKAGIQGKFIHDSWQFYQNFYKTVRKLPGASAHDLTALAYLMHPEYFETKTGGMRVVTDGIARGQTILSDLEFSNWENTPWEKLPLVKVCTSINTDKVIEFITECLVESQ